jgi:hypothetical protein
VLTRLRGELRVDHVRLEDLDPAAGRYGLTAVLLGGRVPGPWGTLVSVELATTLGQPGPASWSALVLFLKPL